MKQLMNFFAKKDKAIEEARAELRQAQIGQLKAQKDMDWAESMQVYYKLREESLAGFIARLERIEAPTTLAAEVGPAEPAFPSTPVAAARPARRTRNFPGGPAIVEPALQGA